MWLHFFQMSKGLMYKETCDSIKNEQNTGVNVEEPFKKHLWPFHLWQSISWK